MSVQMKVKLVKLKSDDDHFDYSQLGEEKIGTEFWVDINTVSVRNLKERLTGTVFQTIMVKASDGPNMIPVELLEFINEFRTST